MLQAMGGHGPKLHGKIAELRAACRGLKVPQILALRRMAMADPATLRRASAAEIDAFFTQVLDEELEEFSFESLELIAERAYAPLLPPGPEPARAEDRRLIERLSQRFLNHRG
jgi:hypothetical protein